jgi:N-acetyl-gamma-glutamyl-phosphate reductase
MHDHAYTLAMGATATVLGASGYAGGELLRLLAHHPVLTVAGIGAHSRSGEPVGDALPHVAGVMKGTFGASGEVAAVEADVCFSCLPSGELAPLLEDLRAEVVVDFSDEHRADPGWVYGLPELNRAALPGATRIANPGCYPTATLLCLVPFAAAGVIAGPIVVDALSGSSGAGRTSAPHLMLAELAGNATAYGSTEHRHVPEMERGMRAFAGLDATVSFTPHLIPTARGLLVTARAPLAVELDDGGARAILHDAYDAEPFVDVLDGWPGTKALSGSNSAHVSARVDARSGYLVASAAIDNLGKGAAGQAIQNVNAVLGIDETTGISALGVWP